MSAQGAELQFPAQHIEILASLLPSPSAERILPFKSQSKRLFPSYIAISRRCQIVLRSTCQPLILLRSPVMRLLPFSLILMSTLTFAHDPQQPLDPSAPKASYAAVTWATRHMLEEHHLNGWDADTLFSLHDLHGDGYWDERDVQRMYGMLHKTSDHVTDADKEAAAKKVVRMYDHDRDGKVSKDEFVDGWKRGIQLPDLGFGPGHHGDEEWEYEIHHFEKYHGENAKPEDLTHPEDVEHFKWHAEQEKEEQDEKSKAEEQRKQAEESRRKAEATSGRYTQQPVQDKPPIQDKPTEGEGEWADTDADGIVVENIPAKFRRAI